MKAAVCPKYGPPEVLELKELPRPAPEDSEVLIRVHAAAVTASDCIMRRGKPFIVRTFSGLLRPKRAILGSEFSGQVEAVGPNVARFRRGDEVFGSTGSTFGAFAEYVSLPEDAALAGKPSNVTHEEAASLSEGGLTALVFLRGKGNVAKGHRVLINGASGSVGTAAVQIAKQFGAEVTGVCSSDNVDLVKSLGADQVVDYTRDDFTSASRTYDIVFDAVGKSSYSRCKRSLTDTGIYLTTVPTLGVLLRRLVGSKRAAFAAEGLRKPRERAKDLVFLRSLIESGTVKPVVDRSYRLEQIVEAHRYVDRGHKKGNVIVQTA